MTTTYFLWRIEMKEYMEKILSFIEDFFYCKELAIFKCICIALLVVCIYALYWIFTVGIYLS